MVRGSSPSPSLVKLFSIPVLAFQLSIPPPWASPLQPPSPSPVLAASLWACTSCSFQGFASPLPVAPQPAQPLGLSQLMGWWGSTTPPKSYAPGAVWLTCPAAFPSPPRWDQRGSAASERWWVEGKGERWGCSKAAIPSGSLPSQRWDPQAACFFLQNGACVLTWRGWLTSRRGLWRGVVQPVRPLRVRRASGVCSRCATEMFAVRAQSPEGERWFLKRQKWRQHQIVQIPLGGWTGSSSELEWTEIRVTLVLDWSLISNTRSRLATYLSLSERSSISSEVLKVLYNADETFSALRVHLNMSSGHGHVWPVGTAHTQGLAKGLQLLIHHLCHWYAPSKRGPWR